MNAVRIFVWLFTLLYLYIFMVLHFQAFWCIIKVVICMSFKKKISALLLCGLMVFSASCSCGGDSETVKGNDVATNQVETNEKGEVATETPNNNNQNSATEETDAKSASDEKADSNNAESNTDKKTDGKDETGDVTEKETTKAEKETTKAEKETTKAEDETQVVGEDPMHNAQGNADDFDFE